MNTPIVSYAQNQEDIILYRVLRNVSKGFYIDVGAQHPIVDSVTKLFYERGWHGINIDPVPQWAQMLKADRPHDINLQMAVGAHRNRILFFDIPDTGLSTANSEFSARHAKMGLAIEEIIVDVYSLDEICDLYGVHEAHFLKIDAEGAEKDIILGFSFNRIRPWVVVVEAIEPVYVGRDTHDGLLQVVPAHAAWEPLLLAHGYEFVYWDGINRFYLAHERKELCSHFGAPPNLLDEFIRHEELKKGNRIAELEVEHKHLTDMAAFAQGQITALEQDKARLVQDKIQLEQDKIHLHLLCGERNALRSECDLLRSKHEALCGERDALQGERDALRGMQDMLRGERDALRGEWDVLCGKHEALCGERDVLCGERDALRSERDALCSVQDTLRAECDALRGERDVLQREHATLRNERDALHGERDTMRNERDALCTVRDTLCAECDALRGERDALSNQRNVLCSERDALRSELDSRVSWQIHQEQVLAQQQATLQAIVHSRSWRITSPLRWTARQFREVRSLPRRSVRQALLVALRLVRNHGVARRMAGRVLALAPARVRNRLILFAQFHPPHIQPNAVAAVAVSTVQELAAPDTQVAITQGLVEGATGQESAALGTEAAVPAFQNSGTQIIYSRLRSMAALSHSI